MPRIASELECRCFDEYLHQLKTQSRGSLDFFNFAHLISAKPCWMRRKRKLTQGEQISGWAYAERGGSHD